MKLCPVIIFPGIVKDCPKVRNLPKIFLRSFENVGEQYNSINNVQLNNTLHILSLQTLL